MSRDRKNKISIYLIKEGVPPEDIIKIVPKRVERLLGDKKIFIVPSAIKKPKWVERFFDDNLDGIEEIFSSIPNAAVVVPIISKDIIRQFVITFGGGSPFNKKRSY